MLGSMLFGGWCSTILWLPRQSDVYGRTKLFRYAMCLTLATFTTIYFSKSYLVTLLAILITGLFTSLRSGVGWPLLLELVPKSSRPLHAVVFGSIGAIEAMGCVVYFTYVSNNAYYFMGIGLTCQVIVVILTFMLPESPVYLLTRGKMAEAEVALARIAKINGKPLQFNPNDFSDWHKQELETSMIESPISGVSPMSLSSRSGRIRRRSEKPSKFTAAYFLKQKKI